MPYPQHDHTLLYPASGLLWRPEALPDLKVRPAGAWAEFATHEQAAAFLALSFAALDRDLADRAHSLRRLRLPHASPLKPAPPPAATLCSDAPVFSSPPLAPSTAGLRPPARMCTRDAAPPPHLHTPPYTLSTNPPNPRPTFRSGDWICPVAACAAHNFGRNVVCRICGSPRSTPSEFLPFDLMQMQLNAAVSPRFAATMVPFPARADSFSYRQPPVAHPPPHRTYSLPLPSVRPSSPPPAPQKPPAPAYPLLTPSGRALSVGGRVQNISTDPLSPCIMYWPDNEAFPAQGQIRPATSTITYPPIINTGNKGAAEKQPGDWICKTCHYHNWRRRKVCQTCFPYAEGNGDSISTAVQAERIALLENVLAVEMHEHARSGDVWPAPSSAPLPRSAAAFGLPRTPAPAPWLEPRAPAPAAPLLPAFLQDIVPAPSLEPAAAEPATAEPALDESASAFGLGLRMDSIWRLGGDESRFLGSAGSSPAGSARREP